MLRPEILARFKNNTSNINLMSLDIKDNELQDILTELKKHSPDLTVLHLDNNNIGDDGAIILYRELKTLKDFQQLSIQFNKIGKYGATELFKLRKIFPDLDIAFHGNKITDVGEMYQIEQAALK